MATLMARMERDGWVERRSSPHDAREKHVILTPKAEALVTELLAEAELVRVRVLEGVNLQDFDTCSRVLAQVEEKLSEMSEAADIA